MSKRAARDRQYRKSPNGRASRRRYFQRQKEAWLVLVGPYKKQPCLDCGRTFSPVCMDFDHRDPKLKLFNIGMSVTRKLEDVAREIAKCDVVCSNCHRVRTHRTRSRGK